MLRTQVDFSKHIRQWVGFGINYVESSQTRHYDPYPQEYGGFSLLTEEQRQEIIHLTHYVLRITSYICPA